MIANDLSANSDRNKWVTSNIFELYLYKFAHSLTDYRAWILYIYLKNRRNRANKHII